MQPGREECCGGDIEPKVTFQTHNQRHLQFQLPAGLGDAVGDDGTVHDAPKDVHQYGLHLRKKNPHWRENVTLHLGKQQYKAHTA